LKQLQRSLRVAGVVPVSGGDVGVAVQAQQTEYVRIHEASRKPKLLPPMNR
jgi:hypothetical protein